jgi:hypothetical protein
LYLPATQIAQVPPFVPVKPALQAQSVAASLPAGEFEFAWHAEQVVSDVCPTAAEYLPLGQKVQAAEPVEVLYVPAEQLTQISPLPGDFPGAHSSPWQNKIKSNVTRFCG